MAADQGGGEALNSAHAHCTAQARWLNFQNPSQQEVFTDDMGRPVTTVAAH